MSRLEFQALDPEYSLLAEQGVFSVTMMPGTVPPDFASVLYLHFDAAGITAQASEHQTRYFVADINMTVTVVTQQKPLCHKQ